MALEKCNYCGTSFSPEYSFCPYCGKPVILTNPNIVKNRQIKGSISVPSKNETDHVEITLPSRKTVAVLSLFLALVMAILAILQIKSDGYAMWKNHREECIANQQELGVSAYSQKLNRDYDNMIAGAEEKMGEYESRATIFAVISAISLGCGLIFFPKRKKQRMLSSASDVSFCSNCGCKLQEKADFCPSCGNRIATGKEKATAHRSLKYFVFGLIAFSLLVGVVLYRSYRAEQEIFKRAFESAGGKNFCGEWVTLLHDGSGLKIDTNPADIDNYYDPDALTAIKKINSALNLPNSLIEKMIGTRALDGRQTATYDGIAVSWTYHPDYGLEILYERN